MFIKINKTKQRKTMNKMIKTLAVMLTVFSFATAQAGVLEVTGNAKMSYVITGSDSATAVLESSKGLGVANEFSLGASGELDNGFTWTYGVDIDGTTVQDDARFIVGMPNIGTLAMFISEGGLEFSKAAAVTANGDRASDTGYVEGMVESYSIGDMNSIQYHSPADLLPYGMMFKVAYAPSTTAAATNSVNAQGTAQTSTISAATTNVTGAQAAAGMGSSMESYNLMAKPIDGLEVGASYSKFGGLNKLDQEPESGAMYAKYVYGPATFAYGQARIAHALTDANTTNDLIEDTQNTKMSLAYLVNDDLSLSYSEESSEANHKTAATVVVELESTSLAAAYTMGGMTIAVAQVQHENVGYVAGVDVNSTVFNVTMAF
jgi:hypothetical protein